MMEVVKRESLKLLDMGVFYSISNNPWMSPMQVVPKKAVVTVEANHEGKLIPIYKPTRWRQCMHGSP